jgi:hypothetical protein
MNARAAIGVVVVAALAAACSGSAPTYQPTAGLSEQCDSVPAGAKKAQVTAADGFVMGAAALGTIGGSEGVVISYGQGQTICDWLDIGDRVASATGVQVLILERRGKGSSPGKRNYLLGPGDVASGVNYLQAHGARKIVVVGSSLGTLFAFIGSSPTGPRDAVRPSDASSAVVGQPPCAVALVSPLLSWSANGGELRNLDVRSLQSKVFITYESRNATIADDADQVKARATAVGATVVQTVAVDTKDHGLRLVREHPEAFAVLKAAVDACG